jgi:hypothetical protein
MTKDERRFLIEEYKRGVANIRDALKGITEAELDFTRAPGKWSAREIVHHLADSETTSAIRLRKLLTEHTPYIQAYDQDVFAKTLHYAQRPIEPALKAFEAARENTAQILELMKEEDWQRMGEHAESGPYSTETWLSIYAVHAHNHADQIWQNRTEYKNRRTA